MTEILVRKPCSGCSNEMVTELDDRGVMKAYCPACCEDDCYNQLVVENTQDYEEK